MIEVEYKTDLVLEGRTFEMKVKGHADYADKGQDIVCAGVSALVIALIRQLEKLEEEGKATNTIKAEEGNFKANTLSRLFVEITETSAVYETVYTGLKEIALQHPEHVKII